MKPHNPIVKCADGFEISIQASKFNYSTPRQDVGPYITVECGFPSSMPNNANFREYAEPTNSSKHGTNYTETVYGYVPIEIVIAELESHGGIVSGKLPE